MEVVKGTHRCTHRSQKKTFRHGKKSQEKKKKKKKPLAICKYYTMPVKKAISATDLLEYQIE